MNKYGTAQDWVKLSRQVDEVIVERDGQEFKFGIYRKIPVFLTKKINEIQEEIAGDDGKYDILELIIRIMPDLYIERPDGFTDEMFMMDTDTPAFSKLIDPIKTVLENSLITKVEEESEKK